MTVKRLSQYCLLLIILIFLTGYILVAFNNRFQFDDLGFSAMGREHGIWKAFVLMYYSWETTYNTLILFLLLKGVNWLPPYVYNVSIFLFTCFAFDLSVQAIVRAMKMKVSRKDVLLFSLLVIAFSYFSCRAAGNAVYWVTGQIVYSLFLNFLFLGLYFWINKKWFYACFFMFLFGHTRINYDAIFIGLYAGYILFCYFSNNKKSLKWNEQLPVIFFFFGMVTYVIIPGNYHRVDSFHINTPHQNIVVQVFLGWVSAIKHLLGTIIFSWKQLVILPVGFIFGVYCFFTNALSFALKWKNLLYGSIIFLACYMGQSAIMTIAIGTPVGYGRIFFFLEMLLFILLLLFGIKIGTLFCSYTTNYIQLFATILLSLSIMVLMTLSYYKNYEQVKLFSKSYDERINLIVKLRKMGNTNTVYLSPLPNSGILNFMEIAPQPADSSKVPDANMVYIKYYHLPFKIYLDTSSQFPNQGNQINAFLNE